MAYVVTGGTGFIGRHLLGELSRRGRPIHVLVREQSRERLERLRLPNVRPLVGDVTKKDLGVGSGPGDLQGAEIFHLAAVYDLDADEEANRLANVEGTRHVLEFARRVGAAR
nr:SDR family oxidoreductase [Candidatus Dormibacteraeota bacterium]